MSDLRELIGLRKADRSYEQLSRACGGTPSAKRLHMLATQPMRNFPDPDTIRGLSKGLGVTEMTIVLAAAESLGLDVRTPDSWAALMPAGAERIPTHMRDAILSVIQAAVDTVTPQTAASNHVAESNDNLRHLHPPVEHVSERPRVSRAAWPRPDPEGKDGSES